MNFNELIWREPWLAPVAMNLNNIIETKEIETAGVTPDGKTLYYNPEFWRALKNPERLAVQIHELLHIVNLHSRRRNTREHIKWNMACDISINYQIAYAGYILPAGVFTGMNEAAENIYELLNVKEYYGKSGYAKFHLEGDLLGKNIDGSDNCENSDTLEAVENCISLAGKGTSELSKTFRPAMPKGDWRTVLQKFAKSVLGDDVDYLSYEFDEFGICEDILTEKPLPSICVLLDESGSIEDALYQQFLGELSKMSKSAKVFVSGFTDNTELNAVALKDYRRTMTGGTDVTLTYRQACEKKYDGIIILTDGCLDFPDSEPIPTIWVMPGSHKRKTEVII